jgi:hypothetical protein
MCHEGLCKSAPRNCADNSSACNLGEDFCCSHRCVGIVGNARCLPP